MSILRFLLKKKDGDGILPNPNGTLFGSVSPRIIDECNQRVSEVLCASPSVSASTDSPKSSAKKRGKYATYSPSDLRNHNISVVYIPHRVPTDYSLWT